MIDLAPSRIHKRVVQGIADQPSANVTIKTDVPSAAFNYLLEHREEFPGVVVEKKYLRHYPFKTLGAQLFGTLREISPDEIGTEAYRGVSQGTRIGKDGIEESYDRYLRGTDGFTRVIVNSFGNRDDTRRTTRTDPIQGRQLRLTLDLGLQRAAQDAVARALEAAHGNGNPADAGAFVAMDPNNGEVFALGSYPSFDANLFAKPIDQETYEQLNSEENGAPLFNRAISAGYPTGSTFKPITAFAAVDNGIITPTTVLNDPGVFEYGNREFKNAGDAVFGSLALARAIQVSSDVFFYQLGAALNDQGRGAPGVGAPAELRQADGDRHPRRVRRPRAGRQVAQQRVRQVPPLREEGERARGHDGGAVRLRRHRARLERRRQRQPRRRPGRPAGDAAAARHRVRGDRQRRPRRHAAPRPAGRGRRRAASSRRSASPPSGASTSTRRRSARSARACAPPRGRAAARRPTSSPASRTPSTARRAPPSARRTPTSPGTPATSTTPSSRSSSW